MQATVMIETSKIEIQDRSAFFQQRQRFAGTYGIFLSMSGYSRAALTDVALGERLEVLLLSQDGTLKACVRTPTSGRWRSCRQDIRMFAPTTNALLELREWLVATRAAPA